MISYKVDELGYYVGQVQSKYIPMDCVPIDPGPKPENGFLKFNRKTKSWDVVAKGPKNIRPSLEDKKIELQRLLNSEYQEKINKLTEKYSEFELETFKSQEEEYQHFLADENAKTPIIDTLAETRNISREEMAGKIGNKIQQKYVLLGQKQAAFDKIKNATSIVSLNEIIFQRNL